MVPWQDGIVCCLLGLAIKHFSAAEVELKLVTHVKRRVLVGVVLKLMYNLALMKHKQCIQVIYCFLLYLKKINLSVL